MRFFCRDLTYGIHTESVHSLLILLSTPLFSSKPAFLMKAYRALMQSEKSLALTRTLLTYFAQQNEAPSAYLNEEGGSLVIGLATSVWSVLTLGYGTAAPAAAATAQNGAAAEGDEQTVSKTPLGDVSMLLLLVLTNHCTDQASLTNPFREALFRCSGLKPKEHTPMTGSASDNPSFRTDFSSLFRTLSSSLATDESTLLLYLLVHQCRDFRSHVLASSENEKVILPILRTLYNAPTSNNHHIYMR